MTSPRVLLPGFEHRRVDLEGITISCAVRGSGPPVLMLHGYPQNHLAWRHVAPALAEDHTVVLADLRGYGDSDKPAPDAAGLVCSKRTMARDQVGLMPRLGFESFHLVGVWQQYAPDVRGQALPTGHFVPEEHRTWSLTRYEISSTNHQDKEIPMSGNGSSWKPDGSGWRARIGVLTHDDSAISESELWTMAPDGVSLHTSRVFFADLATFADPPGPENATELLARLPLQAIIYAWTVGSYLLGTTGEEELVSRVEQHSNGIPVLMPAPAATAGFRTLEAERIALIHAPFFTDDFDQRGVAYFQERGFDVVHVSHLMPAVEVPHPNTGSVASPAEIYEWVRGHVPPSAQAVFIGGNAVRAVGVIAALEDDLGRPVVTANQVSLWYALRMAGAEVSVDDYGQLFKLPCRESEIPARPT